MRACDWGPGPSEGGGGLDASACAAWGLAQGTRSPRLVPQGERELAGEDLWLARKSASLGWACWVLCTGPGPRRSGAGGRGGTLVDSVSKASLHLPDDVVGV